MLSATERARYARHLLLPRFGEEGQEKLKAASAVIIGAGGLGSPAAMYLAAAGVGRIGVVDFDTVDVTNLQRQLLHDSSAVGRPKVDSARERLQGLNSEIAIEAHATTLSAQNALEILGAYDVVVDGSDNFPTRYLVNDACSLLGKPNVYGSALRFEGQVSLFNTADGPCYRCLYPEPPPAHLVPSCATGGVLGVLPGIIGTIQAAEAIKVLTGIGEALTGRLLLVDVLEMSFREVRLRKNCHQHERVSQLIDYERFCNPMDINAKDLAGRMAEESRDFFLLDVREPHEWERGRISGASHIPMQQVPARLEEIPRDAEVVVYCRSGGRSARVQQFLTANGFANVRNLVGGITAWKREVDPTVDVA